MTPFPCFVTRDYDPTPIIGGWRTWSDKEGWYKPVRQEDPYDESGIFLGHYLISRPPRYWGQWGW